MSDYSEENNKFDKLLESIEDIKKNISSLSDAVVAVKRKVEELENKTTLNYEREQLLLWQIYKTGSEDDFDSKKRFFKGLPPATGNLRKMQKSGFVLLREFDRICRERDISYWLGFGTLLGAVRHGGFIPWDDDVDVCMLRSEFDRLYLAMSDNSDFICYENFGLHAPVRRIFNHGFKIRFKNISTPCTMDIFIFDDCKTLDAAQVNSINEMKQQMADDAQKLSLNPGKAEQGIYRCRTGNEKFEECKEFFKLWLDRYLEILKHSSGEKKIVWAIDNLNFVSLRARQFPYDLVFPLRPIDFEGHTFLSPNKPHEYLSIMYGDFMSIPDDMLSHKHFVYSEKNEMDYTEIEKRFL